MALEQEQWTALLGVAAVLIAVFLYGRMKARNSPIQAAAGNADGDDVSVDSRLSRFVVHDGDVIGESVAVEGGALIVKQAGHFRSVPLAQTELRGDEIAVVGDLDMAAADAAGAAWLAANTKGQDDAVTADLTKSEDVKAPAREAFERRQKILSGEDPDATDADSEE